MPYAERGTHRLYYETQGELDAPALLLIMGMGFSSRAWGALPEHLAATYRVIVFDNPGTGRSTVPWRFLRVSEMADDAAAVLNAVGAPHASVFGISMGGMIALELALRHPERVRALALGATFAGWGRSRKPSVPVIGDLLLGGVLSRLGKHGRLAKVLVSTEGTGVDLETFGSWVVNGERVSPRVLARQMAAVTFHATDARLAELVVPTLVISGDCDRLVPVENSRRLAERIPGARLVVLPGAGHCFPLERVDDVMRELTAFFGTGAKLEKTGRRRIPRPGPPPERS